LSVDAYLGLLEEQPCPVKFHPDLESRFFECTVLGSDRRPGSDRRSIIPNLTGRSAIIIDSDRRPETKQGRRS